MATTLQNFDWNLAIKEGREPYTPPMFFAEEVVFELPSKEIQGYLKRVFDEVEVKKPLTQDIIQRLAEVTTGDSQRILIADERAALRGWWLAFDLKCLKDLQELIVQLKKQ